MLALALRIAAEINGRLVGAQAIRRLVSDFPDGTYDVVGTLPWQPANGEDSGRVEWSVVHGSLVKWRVHVSGQIRVGTWVTNDIYHGCDNTKCWYNSDGTYFASPSMQRLAETRMLEDEYDNLLNNVLKFESCGFHNTSKRHADVAFYEPSILSHCVPRQIERLVVCGTLVDDRLALAFSRCEFARIDFYECTVTASIIHTTHFVTYKDCIVLGTHNTSIVNATHINGYLTFNRCAYRAQFDGTSDRDTIETEEQREYMRLCVQFLAELPVTARAYKLAKTIDVRVFDRYVVPREYYVAMTKYKSIFDKQYCKFAWDAVDPNEITANLCRILTEAGLSVPMEWITDIQMLVSLSEHGLVAVRHPFFAQRVSTFSLRHIDVSSFEKRPTNNIASFLCGLTRWSMECPLYPVVRDCDYLQMHVPLDQVDDALNTDGFSVEMMDMLIDQISVFGGACNDLRNYLRDRGDTPPYLLSLFS